MTCYFMNRPYTGGINMNEKQIEMMKKLIEEKKQKGNNTKNNKRPKKVIGRMLLDNGKTTQ
jgi:hypothetical protein